IDDVLQARALQQSVTADRLLGEGHAARLHPLVVQAHDEGSLVRLVALQARRQTERGQQQSQEDQPASAEGHWPLPLRTQKTTAAAPSNARASSTQATTGLIPSAASSAAGGGVVVATSVAAGVAVGSGSGVAVGSGSGVALGSGGGVSVGSLVSVASGSAVAVASCSASSTGSAAVPTNGYGWPVSAGSACSVVKKSSNGPSPKSAAKAPLGCCHASRASIAASKSRPSALRACKPSAVLLALSGKPGA